MSARAKTLELNLADASARVFREGRAIWLERRAGLTFLFHLAEQMGEEETAAIDALIKRANSINEWTERTKKKSW